MDTPPAYTELADKAGISRSYANEIASGQRKPSLPLAAHIFVRTGWKAEPVAMMPDDAVAAFARAHPFVSRPTDTQVAA